MTLSMPITAPYWPEPVSVVSQTLAPLGFVTIEAIGQESGRHYSTILQPGEWHSVNAGWLPSLDSNPQAFRLALEAERLRLAYSCDPLLATNNSRVDLLPHQMEAVYDIMLPQPTIRHLMAHDAGAGKTVMCGLLHKELRIRNPRLRTLIVAPDALTRVWKKPYFRDD